MVYIGVTGLLGEPYLIFNLDSYI